MSWIEEKSEKDATGELREIYSDLREHSRRISNVIKAHSLNPHAMRTHLDLYKHLLYGSSSLTRAERETIAVAVSAINNDPYNITHHGEALSKYQTDNQKLRKLLMNLDFIDLPDRTALMLTYAVKLTVSPNEINEDDVSKLRGAGFDDRQILDINLVASYFNFLNRVTLGLGVDLTDEDDTNTSTKNNSNGSKNSGGSNGRAG